MALKKKKLQKKTMKKIKPQKVIKGTHTQVFLFLLRHIHDETLFLAFYRAQLGFIVVSMQK
jgi:hypothetical protein